MKSTKNSILNLTFAGLVVITSLQMRAGNPERSGQAGGSQLLINPYARSAGWAGANIARTRGLESQFTNVAGLAFTRKTEVMFTQSTWLVSGVNISNFGFSQRVGETGAIGLGFTSINAGKIDRTTVDNPEPVLGTFSPRFLNIAVSYAKGFSDNIYGGVTVRILSEGIDNSKAQGVALDGGIQYHTGKYDQFHLGFSFKNWGPKMQNKGDGLSIQSTIKNNAYGNEYEYSVNNKSAAYELPALLNIGAAYDFYLTKDTTGKLKTHRLTVAGNFTSNSFTKDNFLVGVEYGWKEILMVRAGMIAEKGLFGGDATKTNIYTGPSCGATFELPIGAKKSTFGLDYSYRFTNPFRGVHSFGARINF